MGKNRDMNPMEKMRREMKEKERKKNKATRSKGREVTLLRNDPKALQDEIRQVREGLQRGGDGDEGQAALRRKLKRLQDDYNAVLHARKKADPKVLERFGIQLTDRERATAPGDRYFQNDPLNPENGGDSRFQARTRALNGDMSTAQGFADSAGAGPAPAQDVPQPQPQPVQKVRPPGGLMPSSLRKKPAKPAIGSGAAVVDVAPPVNEPE
mmetsp:Transcript_4548/g.13771  ORF Transcript_4548/g.13771 Transcript_4548/m.13771 type:complete len:211 (-) Transcript_4548:216-848(-)